MITIIRLLLAGVVFLLPSSCVTLEMLRGSPENTGAHGQVLEVGGVRYEVAGEGNPVVLIHGGGLDRRMWDRQFELLAGTHKVIRYDVRGFGESEVGTDTISHVVDLRGVLEAVGAESPVLVGLSLGGAIAINYALTYPSEVERLLLAAPALPGASAPPEEPERFQTIGRLAAEGRTREAAEEWLRTPHMRPAMANQETAERIRELALDNNRSWAPGPQAAAIVPPAAERLSEIRIPTSVIIGESDDRGVQEIAARVARDIAGAELTVIPGVGHIINMEASSDFDSWLLARLVGSNGSNSGHPYER